MSMFVADGEDPRTYGNPQGELATYREYLTNYRLTLGMKCRDLTAEELATRSVPPSTLSLLGLVRHMARVENSWFQRVINASGTERLYWSPENHDLDFDEAVGTEGCVTDAFATWHHEVGLADAWLDALGEDDLGVEYPIAGREGEVVSARDLIVHMIEEYARHCGHADLLRECLDGRTGQ